MLPAVSVTAAFAMQTRLVGATESRGRDAVSHEHRPRCRLSTRFREKRRRMMGGSGIRTAKRLRARHGGMRAESTRRESAAPRGLPTARLVGSWQWTRDGREGRLRSICAPSADRLHLSYRVRSVGERMGGRGRDCPHRPRGLPLRRSAALFHLSRRGEWRSPVGGVSPSCTGRAAISYAGIAIALPMPARARAPGIEPSGARARSAGGSVAIVASSNRSHRSRKACGNAHTSGSANCAIEAEMVADQAFTVQAERLLAGLNRPKRKRKFWR